jgi:hypothetical protein
MARQTAAPWLLLIHQIPPNPPYLRVKVWRRLQSVGAVPIKNSVYVLPNSDEAREQFEWMIREIAKDGGEAALCEAQFLDGLDDGQVVSNFHRARDDDYVEIAQAARRFERELSRQRPLSEKRRAQLRIEVARLRKRVNEVIAIDFLGAPRREAADGLVRGLEAHLRGPADGRAESLGRVDLNSLRGKTWVTRKGLHIDRIASGWLIRRFIDENAQFRFVSSKDYEPAPHEIRFDMFAAEFTHEGDQCTFEVLLGRLGLDDPALARIAEIVHDIDLRDAKFARPETTGIDHLITGVAMASTDDEARLAQGSAIFEALYHYFTRKRG